MAQHVEPYASVLGLEYGWEPNAPESTLLANDQGGAALAQRAHFDDPDGRCVVLRWVGVIYALTSGPNDERIYEHRLYEAGLRELSWIGVVRSSSLVEAKASGWTRAGEFRVVPLHYIVKCKERVFEVLAEDVEVFRVDGDPAEAAMAALKLRS